MRTAMSEMWDVKIWMFREIWALVLIILFAYPLHELSAAMWVKLRRRIGNSVPRQARLEVWVMIVLLQVLFFAASLSYFFISKF